MHGWEPLHAALLSLLLASAGLPSLRQASQEQHAAAVLAAEAAAALAAQQAGSGTSAGSGGSGAQAGVQLGEPPPCSTDMPPQHGKVACKGHAAGQPEGQLFVCQSHRVGQLGLLERENAAVLNAALLPLARRVVPACEAALVAAGLSARLWFTGNDGCLLSARDAMQVGGWGCLGGLVCTARVG